MLNYNHSNVLKKSLISIEIQTIKELIFDSILSIITVHINLS